VRAGLCAQEAQGVIPIQELLHRVRWDKQFAQAEFVIGYFDRNRGEVVAVPFRDMHFPAGDHFGFTLLDQDGCTHYVPFHRIRRVLRDGEVIWHRDADASSHVDR
jgi:uncharacterized protein (UPF0248 family)